MAQAKHTGKHRFSIPRAPGPGMDVKGDCQVQAVPCVRRASFAGGLRCRADRGRWADASAWSGAVRAGCRCRETTNDMGRASDLTRRRFLGTAAVAGGLLLPRGSAFGYAANETLQIAVVGVTGRGAGFVAEEGWSSVRQQTGRRIVALCDVNRQKAAEAFQRYAGVPKFEDFRVPIGEMGDKLDRTMWRDFSSGHPGWRGAHLWATLYKAMNWDAVADRQAPALPPYDESQYDPMLDVEIDLQEEPLESEGQDD